MNDNSSYTPGPWFVTGDSSNPIGPDVVSLDDDNACGDPDCCGAPSYWISIKAGDARLISAAPELLEALKLLQFEMIESGNANSVDYGWKPAIEKTRAAIAKATGKNP